MPTIDSDAHVVESERTWDYIDKADQKYRPLIVKPRGEGRWRVLVHRRQDPRSGADRSHCTGC